MLCLLLTRYADTHSFARTLLIHSFVWLTLHCIKHLKINPLFVCQDPICIDPELRFQRHKITMETLLSHSFDYLSSASPQKIRKGLRQVEGLLAQICLSKSISSPNKRHSMMPIGSSPTSSPKKLKDLHDDPAYREFFKLQQSFQWNVTMRLISCLERLLGKESNGTNDLLVIQALDLIQGVLLLHPPSRELFAREIYMNVCTSLQHQSISYSY